MSYGPPTLEVIRFFASTGVANPLADDNTSVTDFPPGEFIVVMQMDCYKGPWNTTYTLRWRNDTDNPGGAYTALSASGEMAWGTGTALTNGSNITSQWCTNSPGGSTWQDGEEVEGAATCQAINLADEYYTEVAWAVDASAGHGGDVYSFELYDEGNTSSIAAGVATLTPKTALDYTHQGGVNGQGYAASQRTVERVIQGNIGSDGYAVSTMSYQSGQLEYTYEGTVAATGFVASQRTVEKYVDGAVYGTGAVSGQRTVEKVVPSSLAATGYAASGRAVEKFYSGLQTGIGTWNSRLVLPVMLADSEYISAGGTTPTTAQLTPPDGKDTGYFQAGYISDDTNPLPAIDLAASDKYTELEWSIIVYGAQTDEFEFRVTNNGTPITTYSVTPSYTIGQLEYVHQGAVSAVASWISQRIIERVMQGTVAGVGYQASDRTIEKLVQGAFYGSGVHASDRTIERVIVTAHLGTGYWISEYSAPLNYIHEGAVAGEGFAVSQKPFSATYMGGVLSNQTWVSYVRGVQLNYVHTGLLESEGFFDSTRFIEKVIQATVQGEGYADSQRIIEKLIQGGIQATGTVGADRTIERLIQGGVFSTNTWMSQKIREMVYIGKVNGVATWASQRVIEKIVTGTLTATDTWISTMTKGGYYAPEVLFVLDTQDVTHAMSTQTATQTMGTQDATFTLATEDKTFTMEDS